VETCQEFGHVLRDYPQLGTRGWFASLAKVNGIRVGGYKRGLALYLRSREGTAWYAHLSHLAVSCDATMRSTLMKSLGCELYAFLVKGGSPLGPPVEYHGFQKHHDMWMATYDRSTNPAIVIAPGAVLQLPTGAVVPTGPSHNVAQAEPSPPTAVPTGTMPDNPTGTGQAGSTHTSGVNAAMGGSATS
jgi:hypothetical protein